MKIPNNFLTKTIGVILVGAIGSGFWEIALQPTLFFIGKNAINLIGAFFSNYQDSLYNKIPDGLYYTQSISTLLLLLYILLILLFIFEKNIKDLDLIKIFIKQLSQKKIKTNQLPSAQKNKSFFKHNYIQLSLMSIVIATFIVTLIGITKTNIVNESYTYSNKSIDIINPYINENERLILKSEFASIKNKDDFEKFKKHLEHISTENNLELPELNL